MTYEPIREDAAPASGDGAAARLSDVRARAADGFGQAKDGLLKGFGRVVDGVEGQIHRAPADLQPAARKAVDFARQRPMATMLGLAAAALLLTRGSRRR